MSTTSAPSLATLAPLLAAPIPQASPELPPLPASLRDGGAALGPLPPAPWTVRQKPRRFVLAGMIPLGMAVVLTLLSLIVDWPGTPSAALAEARNAASVSASAGKPVWYQAPGVTAPVPLTPWPTIHNVPGYPDHTADVVVRFLVTPEGAVDRTGLTVSGRGAGPVRNVTALMYSKMRFTSGSVGGKPAMVVMEHRFHYPM